MKICSLLPSSTEIVYALGLEDRLVAVTHECDYPPEAVLKPRITASVIQTELTSAEIDFRVRQQLENVSSLYTLDATLLQRLEPDVILTQQLCNVCAVAYDNVFRIANQMNPRPTVVNLEPKSVDDIYATILHVGELAGVSSRAEDVVRSLRARQERIRKITSGAVPARLCFLEWLDPPFCAGHWVPELIADAGGIDPFGKLNLPSSQLAWDEINEYNPDILVVSCCGFSVDRTLRELSMMKNQPFSNLAAVRSGKVFVVDGSSYFSRPGPRIIDSLEILAKILHPDLFEVEYPETIVRQIKSRILS